MQDRANTKALSPFPSMMKCVSLSILLQCLLVPALAFTPFPMTNNGMKRFGASISVAVSRDRFGIQDLRRISSSSEYESDEPSRSTDIFHSNEWRKRPMPKTVTVIFFHPHTNREGLHSIEFPKGSGKNIVLAFECSEECQEFAAKLKAQGFFDPSPETMELTSLDIFCKNLGVYIQVIPRGKELVPPRGTVENLGLNPDLKKQELEELFKMKGSNTGLQGILVDNDGPFGVWE